MYCKSAHVSFCKPALTFWELRTVLTEEMYKNVYCAVVLVLMEAGNEHAREILRATEREMWRSYEWQQALKLSRQLMCETNSKVQNIRDLYRGINDFKKGYQPRCNIVKDEKGDLVADSHGIMARWRNYFSSYSTCMWLRTLGRQKYTQQNH